MQYSNTMTECLSNLVAQQPFFAVYLYNQMEIKESSAIKTARTNGKLIEVNPEWFGKKSIGQRVFIMAHEVMHGMLDHMGRTKLYHDRGFGPDMRPFNASNMNDAEDFIINDMLRKAGIGEFPPSGLWSSEFTADMLADEVYVTINALGNDEPSQDPNDPPSESPQGNDEGNNGFDEHVMPEAIDQVTEEETKTAIAQAVQAAEAQGKMPPSLKPCFC